MPPELTEVWATAYLQVLIIIFVFALGIPSLVFQLIVPEDVRHVIHHRWRINAWYVSTVLLALAAIAFIWMIHPHPGAAPMPAWKLYVASGAVTAIPLFATISGAVVFLSYRRHRVVSKLERDLLSSLHPGFWSNWPVFRRFRKPAAWDEESLDDLIYLGANGKSGREKAIVIRALGRLAAEAQVRTDYNGYELEQIIKGLQVVLLNEELYGSDDNFILAAHILQNLRSRMDRNCLDFAATKVTLTNLANAAVLRLSEPTALVYLEDAAAVDSEILLLMGAAALSTGRFFIATAALNKLEAIAEKTDEIVFNDATANLVGLVGCFYVAGDSTRRRAQEFLLRCKERFRPDLPAVLRRSAEYHYAIGNYRIADNLLGIGYK